MQNREKNIDSQHIAVRMTDTENTHTKQQAQRKKPKESNQKNTPWHFVASATAVFFDISEMFQSCLRSGLTQ